MSTPASDADLAHHAQDNGPEIVTASALVIEVDGHLFKNSSRGGVLLPYEDWRLDADARARDLASRLSVEQLAGLMLYSRHQNVPTPPDGPFGGTYGGRPFGEAGVEAWTLSDQQRTMLGTDHIRHVLLMRVADAETAARWNNELQAYAEALPFGVPVNTSSDPRNGAAEASAEFKSAADDISRWPEGLGMAALFDPDACQNYAEIISREYRALGVTTSLSPQADLGTDPRWMRLEDTWGPHAGLVTAYTRAYCDGMQTTPGAPGAPGGWGRDSVATMVKHWPGGGTGEGGRDAHYAFGKFAVYPGDNRAEHLRPFIKGAFSLAGPTLSSAAIMPYYTVSSDYGQPSDAAPRGNAYNEYLIKDLLRGDHGYDGVICTDWGITGDPLPVVDAFGPRSFGVEAFTEAERHRIAIDNGVDQFGGNSAVAPVLDAYAQLVARDGEDAARARLEASGVRLLRTSFRCGLFENPYLDPAASAATVGAASFVEAGYAAQLGSIVLLKGPDAVVQRHGRKVFVPRRHVDERKSFFRTVEPARTFDPLVESNIAGRYERADAAADADFAVVFVESPLSDGYSSAELDACGNGYVPISLQWRPYVADAARQPSLAGGDFREASDDRSYRGKTGRAANESDLDAVLAARAAMGDRPVVVVLRLHNPAVLAELERHADVLLVDLGVSQAAIWDVIAGAYESSGLLPLPLPASMDAVEAHAEDLGFDCSVYSDAVGHAYDFGYGLDYSGVIADERTARFRRP
jgi:beta-glucosidase